MTKLVNRKDTPMSKTWFITGASSGFGRELAELLLQRGNRVAATVRKPDALEDLVAKYGDRLWVGILDVTDAGAVRNVVNRAFAELQRIDVVVSNAGYALFGAAEEVGDAQIERQLNTNLLGSIQVARAAIPNLRQQGGGRIIQISSSVGQAAYPTMGVYAATKWGIEGFFEGTIPEIAPFGIYGDVVVLLHGWPHTSHGWRHVIPKLSRKYRVIAPDLRGLGDSSRPASGYDNGTVAGDMIELLDSLGVRDFSLVGHDWGGPVAFAATLLARDRVRKLALVDTVLVGDGRSAGSGQGGARWHHLFHRTPNLPEALTVGREAIYLSWFYDEYSERGGAVGPEDLAEYVRCY